MPRVGRQQEQESGISVVMGIFVSGGGKEVRDCSVGLFTSEDPNLVFYTQEIEGNGDVRNHCPEPMCSLAEHSRCKVLQTKPETPRATDSRSKLVFARDSNQRCHQTHACGKAIPPSMPTRLLKIRINAGTYAINLVEGAACEPYVAQSLLGQDACGHDHCLNPGGQDKRHPLVDVDTDIQGCSCPD